MQLYNFIIMMILEGDGLSLEIFKREVGCPSVRDSFSVLLALQRAELDDSWGPNPTIL